MQTKMDSNTYKPLNGRSSVEAAQPTLGKSGKPLKVQDPSAEQEVEVDTCCVDGSQIKNQWDLFIGLLIIYTAIVGPYRLVFGVAAKGSLRYVEVAMDLFFITDVIFSFNTAFIRDGQWVNDRREIARKYLKSWFMVDAPASIPVDTIELLIDITSIEAPSTGYMHMMRMLRLIRLARVLRLLELGKVVDYVEEQLGLNLGWVHIVRLAFALLFVTHLVGCAWFTIGEMNKHELNWLVDFTGKVWDDIGDEDRYMLSVYWALTTLTTVGYGDICPTNKDEFYFTMFIYVIGVICFGYMMGSIGGIIDSLDKKSVNMQDRMGYVKQYIEYRKFPPDLQLKLRRYYTQYFEKSAYLYDEENLLSHLTPGLRYRAESYLIKDMIGNFAFFDDIPLSFKQRLLPHIRPSITRGGAMAFTRGDHARSIYFVDKGQVGLYLNCTNIDKQGVPQPLFVLKPGDSFGEECIFGGRRPFAAKGIHTLSHVYLIDGEDINAIKYDFPDIRKKIDADMLKVVSWREAVLQNALRMMVACLPKCSEHRAAFLTQACWWSHLAYMRRKSTLEYENYDEADSGTIESRLIRLEKKLRDLHTGKLESKIDRLTEDLGMILGKFKA